MFNARFYTPYCGVKTLQQLTQTSSEHQSQTQEPTGNLSLRSAVCCGNCTVHCGGRTRAGMMKTMELLCSSVGISVVEPTMGGPVVKPAPAKM